MKKYIGAMAMIIPTSALVISCSPNITTEGDFSKYDNGWGTTFLLSRSKYNAFYDLLEEQQVGIILINNKKIYQEIIDINEGDKLINVLSRLKKYEITITNASIGSYLGYFKVLNQEEQPVFKDSAWANIHINHKQAQVGIDFITTNSKSIYEITYDN